MTKLLTPIHCRDIACFNNPLRFHFRFFLSFCWTRLLLTLFRSEFGWFQARLFPHSSPFHNSSFILVQSYIWTVSFSFQAPKSTRLSQDCWVGVGVRQFFGSTPRSSSYKKASLKDDIARLREELRSELRYELRSEFKDELRREMSQQLESIGISQQHTPVHEHVELAISRRVNTKGSYVAEDEEDDRNTDTSYRCKLFVGEPPQLVAIGKVYDNTSTIHTVPLGHNFASCRRC